MRRPTVDGERSLDLGGIITGIVASARAPGRFAIMVAGKAATTLGLEAIERLGLVVGGSTVGREEAIIGEEAALRVYDRAVMMLAARGRSARDLERQLVRKGEPADLARKAVERLTAQGFVDDVAFARQFVRSNSESRGLATRRLEQELRKRGVEREVIAKALAEVFTDDEIDEAAAAEAIARKRNRSLAAADLPSRRRRLYAFLARRGYSPGVIAATIEKVVTRDTPDPVAPNVY